MDGPLGCLFGVFWLPFRLGQAFQGESRMGMSELDRWAGRFWRRFAVIATVVLVGAVMVTGGVVWWIFNGK